METIAFHPLFFVLPLFAGLSGLFAFAFSSARASRQYALSASLAVGLSVALLTFLTWFGGPDYLFGELLRAGIAIVAAQLIAAPLLDRTRFLGVLLGSAGGSFALLYLLIDELPMFLPLLPRTTWLLATMVAASLCGLIGSALLPAHPARAVRAGQLRPRASSHARDLGLLLFSVAVLLLAWGNEEGALSMACGVSALTAALFPLVFRRDAGRLHRAAEGMLAGTLIGLMLPSSGWEALVGGLVAAVLVERGESIAGALRLDDPARITGVVLLPAMGGMVLPFVPEISTLADALRWLGSTLLAGGVVGLIWFPVMATVGLAASPRRVREGLDFTR